MVAIGNDERAVEARASLTRNLHAPTVLHPFGALHRRVELYLIEDAEIQRVGAKISERLAVRRIGRIFLGEGIILETGIFARRDEISALVNDAGIGRLVPQSADISLSLEAVERNAALAESLGGSKPRRPRADNADLVGVALYIHASRIHLHGPPSFAKLRS